MSHNATLSALVSPTQLLAVEALAGGSSVTAAAKAAGVARETASRWVHHDPVFLAELHNTRAELAAQTRYALEALGMTAVATLCEALKDQRMRPTRLRAACAILKMIGADRAETLAPTTPEDVHVRLLEREQELCERQAKLEAGAVNVNQEPADPGSAPMLTQDKPLPAAEDEPVEIEDRDLAECHEKTSCERAAFVTDADEHPGEPGVVANQATAAAAGQPAGWQCHRKSHRGRASLLVSRS